MKGISRNISRVAAVITVFIAALVIGTWIFTGRGNPVGLPVKFNTGLCLLLSGIALFLLDTERSGSKSRLVAKCCSLAVLIIAMLTLWEHIFSVSTGIDQLFWKDRHPVAGTQLPGRMTALPSCIFILLSICFLLLDKKRFHLLVQVILIVGLALLSLIFLVYITRTSNEKFSLFVPVSLHTSFTLLVLYAGAFLSSPLRYLRFSFQKKMAAFFVFALLLLIVVFFSFRQTAGRFTDTARWVEHTNTAIQQELRIKSIAQDIESSTRGYLISGKNYYLVSYNASRPLIHDAVNALKETTKDNPSQQTRMDTLDELVSSNLAIRDQLIDLRQKGGFDAAQRFFETGVSKVRMDALLKTLNNIEADERKLLAKRKTDNNASIDASTRVIVLFQVVTMIILLVAFIILYGNTRFRNRAEKEILSLNESLERKVEEKTREVLKNELHFRHILDNLLEGAQIVGFDWKYKYVNDAFLIHSKYKRDELLGFTVMEKYPGIEKTQIFSVYEKCFNERIPIHLENEFAFPDGSMGWFELSFQPVPEGIFILSVDITARKKAETLLKELNDRLEKKNTELSSSNTELERFAYVASHDLQEPLRMVSSFLHLLEKRWEGKMDETDKQYINFAVDGAERMKILIQDLLQYSRVGTSKDLVTDVDCNEVLEAVRKLLVVSIGETKAMLNVSRLPVIRGVRPQITQLFQNLVGNALKYHSEQAPVIEVGCKEIKHFWEFYVKDNGIGIDPKFFDKIFVIFQRLHNKTEYAGTGIGLSICKKIVEKHGGAIRVESEPGKGTTFYFTIPK